MELAEQINPRWSAQSRELFQPDILLPVQAFAYRRGAAPEKRLMAAVLEDAVNCFQKYRAATNRRGRRFFREASEWIMTDDTQWEFSFYNICQILDLDIDCLRRGLREWEKQQPPLQPLPPLRSTGRVHEARRVN